MVRWGTSQEDPIPSACPASPYPSAVWLWWPPAWAAGCTGARGWRSRERLGVSTSILGFGSKEEIEWSHAPPTTWAPETKTEKLLLLLLLRHRRAWML